MLLQFKESRKGQIVWSKSFFLLLYCLWIFSFFLFATSNLPGYGAFILSFVALKMHSSIIHVLAGVLAIGNIFILLSLLSSRNQFIKIGLTLQSLLLVVFTILCYLEQSFILSIGYYLWMASQIGACLLLWSSHYEENLKERTAMRVLIVAVFVFVMGGLFI